MKISKLFHWLYASVLFLPLLVIPIFAINIINRSPEPLSVSTEETLDINMYQFVNFSNSSNYTRVDDYEISIDNNLNQYTSVFRYQSDVQHVYLLQYDCFNNSNYNLYSYYYDLDGTLHTLVYDNGFHQLLCKFDGFFNISSASTGYYDLDLKLNLFDITFMFNDNIPSISDFNSYFDLLFYDYQVGASHYVSGVNVIYNDTDIGSQFVYSLYHVTDKYFNFDIVFNFGDLYLWLNSTFFNGSAPLGFFIFWHYLIYWLLISLLWLLFDVLIYVPNLVHRWLDKAAIE